MAEYFEAGVFNILDKATDTYHKMLAIKGEKGDPGPVASEDVIRRVTAEEVAKVIAEAPEDFDTLKEIADWINTHKDDASAMNSAILENARQISMLQDDRDDINDVIDNNLNPRINKNETDINNIKTSLTNLITGTLSAGETSIELTSDKITSSSIIDYPFIWVTDGTEIEAIGYNTVKVENGKVTYTFDAMDTDLLIGIRIL